MQLKNLQLKDIKFRHYLLIMFMAHVLIAFKNIDTSPFSVDAPKPHEEAIKVVFLPPKQDTNPRQIVETQETNLKTDAKAEFLGKTNNAVDRQTVAKTVASFQNAGKGESEVNNKSNNAKTVEAQNPMKRKLSFSDLAVGAPTFTQKSMRAERGIKNGDVRHKGMGQSNDFVKDIPLGDFTKLNTQEYEFYGFYHRIRQKLEQFWGRNIQDQAEKMFKSGRSLASDKNHLTSLTITLNERGEIVGVNINATSGVKELDQAAIKSFNEAGPFPNPPKKMLKGGVAKIEWGFVVNT